jgi:hypothetical protein
MIINARLTPDCANYAEGCSYQEMRNFMEECLFREVQHRKQRNFKCAGVNGSLSCF